MSLRSALGRARGLGSAKSGLRTWLAQRLTAVVLVPLTLWFVVSVLALTGADHAAFSQWVARPLNATLLILLIGAVFWHAEIGLREVIEDYVHTKAVKVASLLIVKVLAAGLGLYSIFAVLKIAFGG